MPAHPVAIPIAHDYLTEPLRLGAPNVCGALSVFPLFGAEPELDFRSFAQANALGASVKEIASGASVNDLLVVNATDKPVLLYEGEEVLGAQQNRTFDISVLVPAAATLRVPVSCVEHGRWDGSRHDESFSPAPQTAYPALRKMKNRQARAAAAQGHEARAVQGDVWTEVADKSARMSTHSSTDAMHDIYEGQRDRLSTFRNAIELHPGQIGALVAIAGRPVVIDHVSRPEVFAALHAPLVQGYALDALEIAASADAPVASDEEIQAFLDSVLGSRLSERDGIGIGREIRFTDQRVGGTGLVAGSEMVQLTAFAEDDSGRPSGGPALQARIGRPSRRRGA